jgi:prophage regulatory protein
MKSNLDSADVAPVRVLSGDGLLRIEFIIRPKGPIPVSRSTWWAGVRSGRFPAPVKLGPRITAWRDSDIQELIESGIRSSKVR